ncbi:hypothetical protein ACEWY4_019346 [Coilia grayii]|uniref:Uncharacterized protein n=1 Tax=Coilia grayii TaxID=363190 RepID=A0ABD1J9H2_9TELE
MDPEPVQSTGTVPRRNAFLTWKFRHHFTLKEERSGRNLTLQCKLCLPATKLLSASKDSTSNLKKHLEPPEREMFAKATSILLSEIDTGGSLIPVQRLNDSDKLSPLALVIKRNPILPWQRPKYQPTGFNLNDVLKGNQTINPEVKEKDFLKYTGTFKDKMAASVQMDSKTTNAKLEGKGSSNLKCNFGPLRKQELGVSKLVQDSTDKQLELEHVLVSQVRRRRRSVLGLVRECVFNTQECVVSEEQGGSSSGLLKLFTPIKIKLLQVNQSGNLEYDNIVSMSVPANTILAYSLVGLRVKPEGQYEVCLLEDLEGLFDADSEEMLEPHTVFTSTGSLPTVSCLLWAASRGALGTALLQQLSDMMGRQEALDTLEMALEDLCSGVTPDMGAPEQDPAHKAQVTSFLQLLPQMGAGHIHQTPPPFVMAMHLLVSALDEMSSEGLCALSSCCSPPVLQALHQLVLRLACEGACPPLDPALDQEEVYQHVEHLFAASGVNLQREAGSVWIRGGVMAGHLPLVMGVAVTGLALLGDRK